MTNPIEKFYSFLARPIFPLGRLLLLLGVIALALSFTAPLWRITLTAPQYPSSLYVDIFSYKVEGGNHGQHLTEINIINHYIGMRRIDRSSLADLDWMPFVFAFLALGALRVAAIGEVRSLVDLAVGSIAVFAFAFARFYYRMYTFGHDLAPDAPVRILPFTPLIFGTRDIANFTSASYPERGAYYAGAFLFTVIGVLAWHLISGRRRAAADEVRANRTGQSAALAAAGSIGA